MLEVYRAHEDDPDRACCRGVFAKMMRSKEGPVGKPGQLVKQITTSPQCQNVTISDYNVSVQYPTSPAD